MPAYVISNVTVFDLDKYHEFLAASLGTLAKYEGKVLVADRDSKVLEGNPAPVTTIVEFDSIETAQRWYDSPEYTEARKIRQQPGVAEGWMIVAPKWEMPQT